MAHRTRVLVYSTERPTRDVLRWIAGEVVDDVIVAASWSRVAPLIREHQPCLAVLDFDGIDRIDREIVARVLRLRYHVSLIAIGTTHAVEDASAIGIATTLQKPLLAEQLMRHVTRIVDARRGV